MLFTKISKEGKGNEMPLPYIHTRNISPVLSLLNDRFSFDEIAFNDNFEVTQDSVAESLELALLTDGIKCLAKETKQGVWHFSSNILFVKSLLYFMSDKVAYPENGIIEEARGMLFSDLPRMLKYRIKNTTVLADLYSPSNESEEELYQKIVSIAKKLG